MTEDRKLTPEEQSAINTWNNDAANITDAAMKAFLPSWFDNMRQLIQANFKLHSIEEIIERVSEWPAKNILVLGSGPSIPSILKNMDAKETLSLCGPTCYGAMLIAGCDPDILVVADSNPIQYEMLRDLKDPYTWTQKVILPVTASPLWYGKDSIFNRNNLYFYLPYLSYLGDTDYAFNHILHALFPEVHRWIAQAGSVSNAMLTIADMICGEDSEKKVRIAVDCCGWLTNPPQYRAPSAKRVDLASYCHQYAESKEEWHQAQIDSIRKDALIIPSSPFNLESTKISLGYAIQMLYLIHNYSQGDNRKERYSLIEESARLFNTLCPEVTIPEKKACELESAIEPLDEENWAYKAMLKLIDYTNKVEVKEVQNEPEESVES